MIEFRYPLVLLAYGFLAALLILKRFKTSAKVAESSRWGEEKVKARLFSRLNSKSLRRKSNLQFWSAVFLTIANVGHIINVFNNAELISQS